MIIGSGVRRACGVVVAVGWLASMASTGELGAASPQAPANPRSNIGAARVAAEAASPRALLDEYCLTCHSDRLQTAGLSLQSLQLPTNGQNAAVWEKVVRKLLTGTMPPVGRPRPDRATAQAARVWLQTALDRAAMATPNPGYKEALHRLNRAEYRNVIRDLLALDVDVGELLPPDDSSFGFDNIAGLLKVNQTGLERYLSAGRKVSRLAVGSSAPPAGSETFSLSPLLPQRERVEGLPFGTRGGALIRYNFPQDGEYDVAVKLHCFNTRGGDENCADGSSGFPDAHQMVVLLDGQVVKEFVFEVVPRRDRYAGDNSTSSEGSSTYEAAERLTVRIPVKAGPRELAVTFLRLPSVETVQRLYRQTFEKPLMYRGVDRGMQITMPHLSRVTISGPFLPMGAGDTPSRRAIFTCQPSSTSEEAACAKSILSRLARRAYRRPVTDADVQPLIGFYTEARSGGGGFEAGIEDALRALLAGPEFWFRIEREPAGVSPTTAYAISDVELASRLSFFLWSSIPDDELLEVAVTGQLKQPAVLERQVRRMLGDARATALTRNFGEQWLNLRRLAVVAPNESDFPNFEESLRQAFARETELFVDSVIREDRSALDLLDADYTFVNGRLAKHYGIPNVQGTRFRRVSLPADSPHRGLLGQGSVLTVTSHPTRTSPVKRGKWVLEQIMGAPPPPPPANVPELEENQSLGTVLTMRERMAEHRANAYCAGCHATIDPVGFALENFDPIGRFRTVDENYQPVDASGTLPDGSRFASFAEFRTVLTRNPDWFLLTLTEKLLTYALGRGLEYYDMPAVRRIVEDARSSEYRLSALISGIVNSTPFRMRMPAGEDETRLAGHRSQGLAFEEIRR